MKRPFTLSLLFIIGCATGGVASQMVVPPVRAGTSPTRWEYFCSGPEGKDIPDSLNRMGKQGWELTSALVTRFETEGQLGGPAYNVDGYAFCFKRPLP